MAAHGRRRAFRRRDSTGGTVSAALLDAAGAALAPSQSVRVSTKRRRPSRDGSSVSRRSPDAFSSHASATARFVRAVQDLDDIVTRRRWVTNDIDPRWRADFHLDATTRQAFDAARATGPIDWVVTNTAFSIWRQVAELGFEYAEEGVALYLRASVHEVSKGKRLRKDAPADATREGRAWMTNHVPTGILWLPRFGHQRSAKTGEWATDNVCTCWVVWRKGDRRECPQFISYAPESVLDELDAETPLFRSRMDRVMGVTA